MDTEPCGSKENTEFLPGCADVNQFMQKTLKAVLQATKCSNEMPAAGDDFDYYSSFQGFQDVMDIEGKRLLHTIQSILKHQNVKINLGSAGRASDIEDKLDMLMDANDQILEKVGSWLDEASGIKKDDSSLVVATATPKAQTSASWNKKVGIVIDVRMSLSPLHCFRYYHEPRSPGSASKSTPSFKLLSARNIQRPQIKFQDKVDNRKRPFIPIIRDKPNAQLSLEESLKLPENVTPEMSEQPDFKYPHPYQYEIDNIVYKDDQLATVTLQDPTTLVDTSCVFINTIKQLPELIDDLKQQTEIAIDLEHHSYRTFQGITCLMQLSTRKQDYLIDTIELRSHLQCLNQVFTDPNIVKVLHGADSDIEWLQRDLGLYIVNMFDTGQASRVMNFSRFSLSYLLQQYCDVTPDKQYQLADWRIRPLPEELLKYAREDTHYLLYIYDKLKNELLDRGNESKNLLMSVLHRSAQLCLKVYKKPGSSPDGYKDLYIRNKKVFNSQQLLALSELFTWRDETARLEDESYGYVLPNHMLLQICDILPREKQGILACCNPIPPLVRQYLNEIHQIIKKAREAPLTEVDIVNTVKRPTSQQHPKYDVNSLLHCPHDLSQQYKHPETEDKPTVLDSSLVATKSSIFSDQSNNSVIVMKASPMLSVFDWKPVDKCTEISVKKKVEEIVKSFISPYYQYLPSDTTKSIIKPAKLTANIETSPSWKLLPPSVKRKPSEESMNTPSVEVPPAKRSRTDLQQERKPEQKHIRFDSDGESIEDKDEDDKKAIPQDIEIPLRYQVPSKKKKKKKKIEDIDIIDSVQKHLAHIRQLQETAERPLGANPGDQQPLDLTEKIKAKLEQKKKEKQNKKMKNKDNKKSDDKNESKSDLSGASGVSKSDVKGASGVSGVVSNKRTSNNDTGGQASFNEPIHIDSDDNDDDDDVVVVEKGSKDVKGGSKGFKPYDYGEATKKLLQGSSTKKNYFDPQAQARGGKRKGRGSKVHMTKSQKSYSWKQK
ncbi:Exosome component 10 [Mactra antiquata]